MPPLKGEERLVLCHAVVFAHLPNKNKTVQKQIWRPGEGSLAGINRSCIRSNWRYRRPRKEDSVSLLIWTARCVAPAHAAAGTYAPRRSYHPWMTSCPRARGLPCRRRSIPSSSPQRAGTAGRPLPARRDRTHQRHRRWFQHPRCTRSCRFRHRA